MNFKRLISLVLAAIIFASACVVVSAQSENTMDESVTTLTEDLTALEVSETTTESIEEESTTTTTDVFSEVTTTEEAVEDEITSEATEETDVTETEETSEPSTEIEDDSINVGSVDNSVEPESEKSAEAAIDAEPEEVINPYDNFVAENFTDYKKMLKDFNVPTLSTSNFFKIIRFINFPFKIITGSPLIPEEHMNVTVDAFIQGLSDDVLEECGLDAAAILTNFPYINSPAELAVKIYEIDTVEFRKQMYEKRDQLWDEGDETKATVYHFLGAYLSIIDKAEIYTVPTPTNPDIYEVKVLYTYRDGGTEELRPGFYINTITGECTNKNNSGVFGIGFNFSITDMVVYATTDSWMRKFGFCVLYDMVAGSLPIFFNYNTRRFKFEYDGLEWMVQIWKGNYMISNGAEVGLYSRTPDKFGTYYNCATEDQMIPMSLQLYVGDELLFERPEDLHWWINGFKIDDTYYPPSSLTMISTLTMRDEEMKDAFVDAVLNHYRKDVKCYVDGLNVTIAW